MKGGLLRRVAPIGLLAAAVALVLLASRVIDSFSTARSGGGTTALVPIVLCLGLTAISIASYVAWPSRWNVVAHTQLAFSVVAYVVPVFGLNELAGLPSSVLTWYAEIVLVGAVFTLLGVAAGAAACPTGAARAAASHLRLGRQSVIDRIGSRLFVLAALAVLAVVVSFVVMGFIPAFASDPLAAKFFRGPYAAPYRPVAPLFRVGTTALPLVLPLIFAFSLKKRSPGWVVLLGAATGVMLLCLLRQPAVDGLLLGVGVALVRQRRTVAVYMVGVLAVYFVGAALYSFLGALGIGGFSSAASAKTSFLAKVASGAPDISDQVSFLSAWLREPQYTHGLTFLGGLIPGHFHWNPSVWSIHILNPLQQVTNITSGGLRLPAPLWGYVSFGWAGVVLVSFANGAVVGCLTAMARQLIPAESFVASVCWIMVYAAALDAATLYRLSYLSVFQLMVLIALFGGFGDKEAVLQRDVGRANRAAKSLARSGFVRDKRSSSATGLSRST